MPDGIDFADMTADIRLLVVGEQMELNSMTAKHIADVFSVADEFERTQDGKLSTLTGAQCSLAMNASRE